MSVPTYSDYKDSGVAWLGAVPSHWELSRFKNLLKERDARSVDGSEELLSVSAYTGIMPKSESTADGEFLSRAESLEGYKLCKYNDLVMNIMLAWNRGLGVTKYDGMVSPAYCVFELGNELHPDFCNYAVRADEYTGYFKAHSAGVIDSRLRLYPDKFGALLCAYPPPAEQTAIATFLDRETAKIDELVAEQQRLIALLKEKRQAVISHAVTKGLNPNAPMKDSGIEWLGEIPAHWEVKRLKTLAESIKAGPFGSSLTKDIYTSSGVRVYGQEQVIAGDFRIGDYYISPEYAKDMAQYLVQPGDILISCVGTFGKISVVPNGVEPGIINPRLLRFRCNRQLIPEYFAELLRSQVIFEQFSYLSRGGTMDVISIGTLSDIIAPVPPSNEQREIYKVISNNQSIFSAVITICEAAIALLQERRAALISAAVTGKIDVRGLVAVPSELETV